MKYSNFFIYPLLLFLTACSQEQMQAALGNSKHTCDYKTKVLATIRNLASKDLRIRFCSAYGDLRSVDQIVPADQNGYTYNVWTYENQKSYYDSAAESCANKGMTDNSIAYSFAFLNDAHLKEFSLCANFNGSASDVIPAYDEEFVAVDNNTSCPDGFAPYNQSRYRCL